MDSGAEIMYTRLSFLRQISSPIFVVLLLVSSLAMVLDSGIDVNQQPQRQNLNVMAQEHSPINKTLSSSNQSLSLDGTSFSIDNTTFSHHTASVNGIQMHYVIGGKGDPVVLLHGWPQTWYEWHKIMPALAKNYTVIAPDLRGLGDSSKPFTGYDGNTTAEDIYQLLSQLGLDQKIYIVGHDIGVQTAYSYAAFPPK